MDVTTLELLVHEDVEAYNMSASVSHTVDSPRPLQCHHRAALKVVITCGWCFGMSADKSEIRQAQSKVFS